MADKIEAKEPLVVLVHPFDSESYDSQPDFCNARERLVRGDSQLVILTNRPNETRKRIGKRDCEIIETKEFDPEPLCGWTDLSRRLQQYDRPVHVCGAELYLNQNGVPYRGCVFVAYERIDVKSKRIALDNCWIVRPTNKKVANSGE